MSDHADAKAKTHPAVHSATNKVFIHTSHAVRQHGLIDRWSKLIHYICIRITSWYASITLFLTSMKTRKLRSACVSASIVSGMLSL